MSQSYWHRLSVLYVFKSLLHLDSSTEAKAQHSGNTQGNALVFSVRKQQGLFCDNGMPEAKAPPPEQSKAHQVLLSRRMGFPWSSSLCNTPSFGECCMLGWQALLVIAKVRRWINSRICTVETRPSYNSHIHVSPWVMANGWNLALYACFRHNISDAHEFKKLKTRL